MKKMQKSLDEKIKTLDKKLMLLEKQDRKYNLSYSMGFQRSLVRNYMIKCGVIL